MHRVCIVLKNRPILVIGDQIIFFLKVNTAREAPAVKFIKGKRGNILTYMAIVSAPWGSAHQPGAKKEEKTIYLTNCTFE
jgi:hypothetical protein